MVALLALWVACAALHVKQVARGQLAWVGVYVAPPSGGDDVPTVRGFWPGAPPTASGGMAVGDRVLRVGDADLRGVGPFGFDAAQIGVADAQDRSEEHTSELQSLRHLVCRLLLEKKKNHEH